MHLRIFTCRLYFASFWLYHRVIITHTSLDIDLPCIVPSNQLGDMHIWRLLEGVVLCIFRYFICLLVQWTAWNIQLAEPAAQTEVDSEALSNEPLEKGCPRGHRLHYRRHKFQYCRCPPYGHSTVKLWILKFCRYNSICATLYFEAAMWINTNIYAIQSVIHIYVRCNFQFWKYRCWKLSLIST